MTIGRVNIKTILRWIAVLPVTVIGTVLVGFIAMLAGRIALTALPIIPAAIMDRLVGAFVTPFAIGYISGFVAPDFEVQTGTAFLCIYAIFWLWLAKSINSDIFSAPIPWVGVLYGVLQLALFVTSCILCFRSLRTI